MKTVETLTTQPIDIFSVILQNLRFEDCVNLLLVNKTIKGKIKQCLNDDNFCTFKAFFPAEISDVQDNLLKITNVRVRHHVSKGNKPLKRMLTRISSNNLKQIDLNIFGSSGNKHFDISQKKITLIGSMHTLSLHNLIITDVSMLATVNKLCFYHCNIQDVSALGKIDTLVFHNCPDVTDVSSLGNVNKLVIHFCDDIQDVSALKNVNELDLRSCRGIRDVSSLGSGTMQKLTLDDLDYVEDISS